MFEFAHFAHFADLLDLPENSFKMALKWNPPRGFINIEDWFARDIVTLLSKAETQLVGIVLPFCR